MSTTLSHTRLTKHTSLIHSHTLAYCQDTRSHSMNALAVMHSRTLSHTHHDRVSRVGLGSVLREVCACAVVTTSSLLLLSCGKRPVSALRVLPSPFSLLLRFPLRCRYQPQRSPATISAIIIRACTCRATLSSKKKSYISGVCRRRCERAPRFLRKPATLVR